jgi:hypothetical protein
MFVNLVAFNVSWISVVVDPVLSIFTRIRTIDLVFMLTAIAFNLLIAGIFIASKRELPSLRKVLGVVWMLLAIPFAIVFINYVVEGRELWILICFGLVFFFIFLELFLDSSWNTSPCSVLSPSQPPSTRRGDTLWGLHSGY